MVRFYRILAFLCILSLGQSKKPKPKFDHPWISPRIINGMNAAEGQAPYQCSIQKNSSHFCGCAIISSDWVLTAAHCLINENVNDIEILVGTNQWNSGGKRYKIRNTIVHEKYDGTKHVNDIALVHAKIPIKFDEKVKPINYSAKEVPPGSNLMMTGWGRLAAWDGAARPDNLQVLNITAISNEECQYFVYRYIKVYDSFLCAISPRGQGMCKGDSGGPIVFGNELVGIINWAIPFALGYPEGHARLSVYYDWIAEKIKRE